MISFAIMDVMPIAQVYQVARRWCAVAAGAALSACAVQADQSPAGPQLATATPIEHLIVIVGENRTFDSLFATYIPKSGVSIRNLLAQGIINPDGTPGGRFALAEQRRALPPKRYTLNPPRAGAFEHLPPPRQIGVLDAQLHNLNPVADARFPLDLPPGPFQITRYVPYASAGDPPTLAGSMAALTGSTGDPVHRFFQMWQQTGGDNARPDLYAWVAVTTGTGGDTEHVTAQDPMQGGELMGFINMHTGDAAYLRALADRYAISDNYHQSIMGGTGANFYALSTADVAVYNVGGALAAPPENQIENPDPQPGTENFYQRDGFMGGSYVNCADASQPGVSAVLQVLESKGVPSGCAPGAYYLVNNLAAGFDPEGRIQPLGPHNFVYPPQYAPTIAASLSARGVSWKWYAGGRDAEDLAIDMRTLHLSLLDARGQQYNFTGDPLLASQVVMSHPEMRSRLQGLSALRRDLARGTLPAVSFVVPKNLDSGHPGYSVVASYESFVRDTIRAVQAHPALWAHTAIIATTDEGGGFFDSGYIQTVDFFGDGPRIPLIVVSPFARRGHVDHVYNDHASILKFIEYNWGLAPLSARSRDNLPNPVPDPSDPYRPLNSPAVGDLRSLFDF
jgi:acid phosphatase